VECGTYIEQYLSAHADGELTGEELRAAEEHVAHCDECRQLLAEERALKRTLHDRLATLKAPAQVRDRIRTALDAELARESAAPAAGSRRPSRSRWMRPAVWVPSAIAALLIVGLAVWKMTNRPAPQYAAVEPQKPAAQPTPQEATAAGSIPMFDVAVRHIESFDRKFQPNVPSDSPADISDAYLNHKMPGYLWNFGPGGYRLVGGRLEQLPNGKMAAFTYYHGDRDSILCTYMHAPGPLPGGALHEGDAHSYYVYKGYSICISRYPRGDFICLLITRSPMDQFMETIAASSL
jgi:hypothetical protein